MCSHQLATSTASVIQGFYKLLVAYQTGFSAPIWLLTHFFAGLCWEQVKGWSSISLPGSTCSSCNTTVLNMRASSLTPSLCLAACKNSEMHRRGFCGHCSSLSQHFHQHHYRKHSEHKETSLEQPPIFTDGRGAEAPKSSVWAVGLVT